MKTPLPSPSRIAALCSGNFGIRNTRQTAALLFSLLAGPLAFSQPIATPWGNVAGIQIDGERMVFETSLRLVNPDWSGFVQSSKYNWQGRQSFTLEDKTYTCAHFLQNTPLQYTTRITDAGRGAAEVDLQVEWLATAPMASAPPHPDVPPDSPARTGEMATAGAYFCVNLPAESYAGASLELIGTSQQPLPRLTDFTGAMNEIARGKARGFRVTGADRSLEVLADAETEIFVRQDFVDQPAYLNDPHPRLSFVKQDAKLRVADYQVYFSVLPASVKKGTAVRPHYRIKADGRIDREPVKLVLDPQKPGRLFAGIGGNFRMQFPDLDAQVVDYCFKHLNVTWGRVAVDWSEWQPSAETDPTEKASTGGMSAAFYAQIEMARELAQRRIPIILSIWKPPSWAVDHTRPIPKGVKLDDRKLQQSADSIANYLVFLKQHYGIEVALFSFNETDYGVEVHQSPEEHALANKVIGATFAQRGLATKMLLGDTGAGTKGANRMVGPTVADRSISPYLGAISFHNYHGLTPDDLQAWAASARETNLPLLADEGGPDSAAHRYPLIWITPWFAQLEIDQYVRIGAACQPLSILPWQLNADYSLLAGGGIYGDQGPLRPTQRFWSLKQLGAVSGGFWLPVAADRPNISCAAVGDIARGQYAVHLTNNGASRPATLSGLPAGVKKLTVYVTDQARGMQLMAVKGVVDGKVSFLLEGQTFTSLIAE
jgi:hypothetical protein